MTFHRQVGFELLGPADRTLCLDCGSDLEHEGAVREAQPIHAGSSLARERCHECGQTLWESTYTDCGADTLEEAVL